MQRWGGLRRPVTLQPFAVPHRPGKPQTARCAIDAKPSHDRKSEGPRGSALDSARSVGDVSYGRIGPLIRPNPARSAIRPACRRCAGKPSVASAASGEMAVGISALAVDRCLGNEMNRTAHGKLDINC
jgi:hypothetical protein